MSHYPHTSVIVTAYNQSHTLPLVLARLSHQQYAGNWELIVCDDGSDDDAFGIVRSLSVPSHVHLQYIWQNRRGERRASSRNNGLRAAQGMIVIFVDGDLVVDENFISRHIASHKGGRTIVYGSRRWLFLGDVPHGQPLEGLVDKSLRSELLSATLYTEVRFQEKYYRSDFPWIGCMGCNFSFVRCEVPTYFDEAFGGWGGEDQEFALRLYSLLGYRLQFCPDLYGIHLDSRRRNDFCPIRPRSQSEIESYIENMVHLVDRYSLPAVLPACNGLGYFELNATSNQWQCAEIPNFSQVHITTLVEKARSWIGCVEHSEEHL